jgi:hypothetical protein
MMESVFNLEDGYKIRVLEEDSFIELQKPLREMVFEDDHSVFPFEFISDDEKKKVGALRERIFNDPLKLYLGLFDIDENFVGWSFGFQENAMVYYMCNSAVLKEHRRKGLYTSLMKTSIDILEKEGFQVIYSRHNATNNSVIIPKLKAGFVISSLEMDDVFGVLVHLKYFTNETRRKIMDYRAGQVRPDEQLKKLFKMN